MKIACVSDIHGNSPALEAVLRDIDNRGIGRILCAGDLTGFGPFPNGVITLLRERNIPCVMGNYDAKVLKFPGKREKYRREKRRESYRSFKWTWKHLTEESVEYLGALPFHFEDDIEGRSLLMAHGSMRSFNDYIDATVTESALAELLEGRAPDIFLTGHTHVPFLTRVGAITLGGCGSAGKPVEGSPDVSYLVIDTAGDITGEIVRVSYDVERFCAALIESGLPAVFADQFRRGIGH